MSEDFTNKYKKDIKRIRDSANEGGIEAGRKAMREHDEETIRRRGAMIENLKVLLKETNEDPHKLTLEKLDKLIAAHPEMFFNLKSWDGAVKYYFLNNMATLKEMLLED